jgi:hypothetical protein
MMAQKKKWLNIIRGHRDFSSCLIPGAPNKVNFPLDDDFELPFTWTGYFLVPGSDLRIEFQLLGATLTDAINIGNEITRLHPKHAEEFEAILQYESILRKHGYKMLEN